MQDDSSSTQSTLDIQLVLFDLDGTLADTAPDLIWALNQVRQEQQQAPLPYEEIRLEVSNGANALIKAGFSIPESDPLFQFLKQRLLDLYQSNVARRTVLFDGMSELLDRLDEISIRWGIVTNKPAYLTDPLMQQLGLTERASTIISGDTTPYQKPHPEPLFEASRRTNVATSNCLYIGDASRDIEAGNSAGMTTLAAAFGYIKTSDKLEEWGADAIIETPLEILQWLDGR